MSSSSPETPDALPADMPRGMGRECVRQIVEVVERDRLRLAGALHSSACQSLSGLQFLAATLGKKAPAESVALAESLEELTKLLGQASTELRGIVRWLRPPSLRENGLVVSLIELAAEVSRAIPCEFQCDDRRVDLDPYVAEQFHQIAHAVAMAAAQARTVTRMEISLAADRQCALRLSVWADANFAESGGQEFCNWELLHLRAQAMGGELTIDSPESGGTAVICCVDPNGA